MKPRNLAVAVLLAMTMLGAKDCPNLTSKAQCVSPLAVSGTICLATCDPDGVEWTPDIRQGIGCGWCACIPGLPPVIPPEE